MSSVEARLEAWRAWSAAPSSNRLWRTRAPRVVSSRQLAQGPKRTRACSSLQLFYADWPWTGRDSWIVWKGERIESSMTFALARRVLWSSWMRALDSVGVAHGARGVINIDDIEVNDVVERALRRALDRFDQLDEQGAMSVLALDLATTIGHAASVRSLGAGARVVSCHVAAITQVEVEAERRRLEHDLGRAHLLGVMNADESDD